MKKIILLILALLVSQVFCSHLTYYGPSGYAFVPNGFVAGDWKYTGFTGGEFVSLQNVRLYPKYLAFRTSMFDSKFEVSLSSTYSFVGEDGYEPQKLRNGLLPVIPALKWSIADNSGDIARIGYSVGAMAPYGVYFGATTLFAKLPVLQPELTLAVSLWTERGYGMVGTRLQTADLQGKPLPLAFTVEGGWASSMSSIGKTEESFLAFGTELNLGSN
ncbi:MAG: hypothetical protein LBB36_06990, partial [Fibromonadaceae bacterium]|nr:hypothetical protein [Fibromonadaceae bacterium]